MGVMLHPPPIQPLVVIAILHGARDVEELLKGI
jgi:hypothetical protein